MEKLTRLVARLRAELAEPAALYLPLHLDGSTIGRVREDFADALRAWPRVVRVSHGVVTIDPRLSDAASRTAAFAEVARGLAELGLLSAWRDERYRVALAFDAPALFELERSAARFFGIRTFAAHANGVVREDDRARMWIARRSPTKPIDPGMLDNLVGGGIPAGASVRESIAREGWEEAGIDSALAARIVPAGLLHVRREQPDGLQLETIFVHDLELPAEFRPCGRDGEVVEHRLCDLDDVLALAAQPDTMTVDAALVAVDYLIRCGHLVPDQPGYCELAELLTDGGRQA